MTTTTTFSIPYGKQNITQDDINAVVETLQADFLTQGPKIDEFETKFADYVGSKYAVAVSNGTAALHLCALALNVNEKSKVITTPITFAASANCIKYCGGEVIFADIDPKTALIDLEKLEELLKSNPKGTFDGIIPVDFMGLPVDLEKVKKLAEEYGLWIIEDACHAPGGYFIDSKNKKQNCGNGNYADLAIFSFHPVKHIASGEGGMVTTNDKNLYDKLIKLRTHGITKNPDLLQENHGGWYYEMQELGYNYRIPDILAALGVSQLSRAEEMMQKRQEIAKRYDEAFKDTKIQFFQYPKDSIFHAYHLYVIQIEDRKGLYDYLRENNIFAQVHYIPVHTMPYYQTLGHKKGDFPSAENYYKSCLSLPMYPTLTEEEQNFVIEKILEFVGK
ncbi:UDP-4-keto-6-deoxy-N-acetylglucosamine 4-aminotransferase [Bernardetia litoralis DSM 6794]|uniref:UDP-4-keto-6-deoxy-N-acetylglucosamine 4-aminotransferase n=1 Tax=Bernardetia litoralis (strain ATCC 23117 / DSM 6794 / NBRC 15988 / NCIMB 1366 / Fx l1 / Sio-4) TaxID=880071 RepID=I4APH4_BERLS|nr:UDP-4-amino-4,6-dideoxy-N-acetyl-beta-L-altrosamine transaminase [Bernardetia litoralis]AFM05859.1 UDP-4-keto-6-deoxy-N-acetylglucosamine 4-aminotransferase [Bernardetia litoralis DSM 6794]